MAYADYTYYTDVYGGQLTQQIFSSLAPRAAAFVDLVTFNRAKTTTTYIDQVKMANCAVVDALHAASQGNKVSENNDGLSVTYSTLGQKGQDQSCYDAAKIYLAMTGLMFKGAM